MKKKVSLLVLYRREVREPQLKFQAHCITSWRILGICLDFLFVMTGEIIGLSSDKFL
jgi:hypothetical protein